MKILNFWRLVIIKIKFKDVSDQIHVSDGWTVSYSSYYNEHYLRFKEHGYKLDPCVYFILTEWLEETGGFGFVELIGDNPDKPLTEINIITDMYGRTSIPI